MKEIELALDVLGENITSIHTVAEWADEMGYESEKYFTRKIRAHYKKSPYKIIVEKRVQRVKEELKNSPEEILFSIALELGFSDNNALYKFIKRHTGKTPSQLKWESEMGE